MKHRQNRVIASICLVLTIAIALFGASPAYAASDTDPQFLLEEVEACAGDTVDVEVKLANNPGILGMTLEVNYNPRLTLIEVNNGEAFSKLEMTKPGMLEPGCRIHWDAAELADSDVKDGVVATLSFTVDENASVGDKYFVSASVAKDGDEIDAFDRDLNVVDVKAASCDVVVQRYVCPDGHTWGAWTTIKDASCDKAGNRQRACTVCGETEVEDVAALGHQPLDAVKRSEIEPTCEEDGSYDSVVYCERCGKELSRTTTSVPKLGHDASPAVEENRVDPTCTEGGRYESVIYCSRCDKELSRTVVELDAYSHVWNEGEVTTEPTCSQEGVKTFTCELCEETSTETIPAVDHKAGAESREDEVASTCEVAGHYDVVVRCENCGVELARTSVQLPLAAHSWGDWSVVLEPTYEREGMEMRTCSVCHLSSTRSIDKLTGPGKPTQTITVEDRSVAFGKTVSLDADVSGDGELTYESADTTVATVSSDGVVTPVKVGTAKITVTASETDTYRAATKTITVTVTPGVQVVTGTNKIVQVKKTVALGAKASGGGKLTFKSSNTAVATVSAKGIVTGKKVGTAKITITAARTANFKAASKTIKVTVKYANTLTVKAKTASVTASLKTLKSKAVTISSNVAVSKAKGSVSYANVSSNATAKKFKVSATTGKVTIPKGTKKGTYQVKVKVTAKGDSTHMPVSKIIIYNVVVK